MARYIFIDSNSGCIFADIADFPSHAPASIRDAARLLDESIGEFGREYVEHSSPSPHADGYNVYRADADGVEIVPVVRDGQDQGTIDDVERLCEYAGFIECISESA